MNLERWILSAAMAALTVLVTPATRAAEATEPTSDRKQEVLYGEPVDRVFAPSIHSWRAIDGQRLVLYVTAFRRPYLVILNREVNSLDWEDKIALDKRSSFIDARFDRIFIDSFPYRIARIEKISQETAKSLLKDKD